MPGSLPGPCKNRTEAGNAAQALIDHLKSQLRENVTVTSTDKSTVGQWLERFIALDNNPRAARIMGEGSPSGRCRICRVIPP